MCRKLLKIILIFALVSSVCGCAELRRKFIRKKKPTKEEFSFYRPEQYNPKPPHERYQDSYVLWRNWQLDLERTEGTSHLRDLNALHEILRHLTAMRDLLKDEKAVELGVQIKHMDSLLEKLKKTRRDIIKDPHSRKLVERVGRVIVNNFSYNRMRDYIKSDSPQTKAKESEE